MEKKFGDIISKMLSIPEKQVVNTIQLLEEGATIPFISRYRKEMTGSLDEVQVGAIKERYDQLQELEKRKSTILSTIEGLGKLTDTLRERIVSCWDATALEDIYLPYKPKRRTRAEIARQKGLEPLATLIFFQKEHDIQQRAAKFITSEVKNTDEAIAGAKDIIAEQVSEDERSRNQIRRQFDRTAIISAKVVKGKEEEGCKYRDYFDFSEPLRRCWHCVGEKPRESYV